MNVLAIGAHPDDIEFGCFGTLFAHKFRGDQIHEIVLTNGELGGDPQIRTNEAIEAANLIGATVHFGNLSEGSLRDDYNTVSFIESTIKELKADIVYTHSKIDRHQDHRNASLASISASRLVREVYEYETPSVVNTFSPQMYVDITEAMKTKLEALKCHKSQSNRRYLEIDAVEGLAKYRAYQAGLHGRLAEAFEVVRVIWL